MVSFSRSGARPTPSERHVPTWFTTSAWLRAVVLTVTGTTLLLLALLAANFFNPVADGLTAQYFKGGSTPPALVRIDAVPSADIMLEAWQGAAPSTFAVTWTGALEIPRGGTYTFGVDTGQQGTISIDGRVVIENVAAGAPRLLIGDAVLGQGLHTVFVQYVHRGGPVRLDVLWGPSRGPLVPLAAGQVHPRKVGAIAWRVGSAARSLLDAVEWAWAGSVYAGLLALSAVAAARVWRGLEIDCSALRWIVAGSLALNIAGIWWGLPHQWAPDELGPGTLIDAVSQHFSHGWFDRWPPVHYYTLTVATGPLLLLQGLGRLTVHDGVWFVVAILITRLVSVGAAAGILVAICVSGTRLFGPRAGLYAAAIFALTAPFVYYAKTANLDVPYLFWFSVSLVFYLRLLDTGQMRDYVLFAVTATLAICTKDQAYALYVLVPVVVLHRLWGPGRQAGLPVLKILTDRRIVAATLTAVIVFAVCHNLLFNMGGFIEHVRYIAGPGNENYRVFPPTAGGRLALLMLTGHLVEISWGWPLTLVTLAGLWLALRTPSLRTPTVWLLCPVISYYLGFVNVILYNYDRFVLPICLVLALFGGLALDRFLVRSTGWSWRTVVVSAALTYTSLYAATVDALMLNDSRYAVGRWMHATLGPDDLVGVSGPRELLPGLECRCEDISSVEALAKARPIYYILSADYAHAVASDTEWGKLIAGLEHETLGYHLTARVRQNAPWPWLPGAHPDLVGAREANSDPLETNPFRIASAGAFTILRDINPTIEIFERDKDALVR